MNPPPMTMAWHDEASGMMGEIPPGAIIVVTLGEGTRLVLKRLDNTHIRPGTYPTLAVESSPDRVLISPVNETSVLLLAIPKQERG